MAPLVILGIDPGSRITGYGLIAVEGNERSVLDYGVVRAPPVELGRRIRAIYEGIAAIVARHVPDEIAIEQAFVHLNPAVALALGQARGAALAAALASERPLAEYAPRSVKLAIVGSGKAEKIQVAHMIRHLLRIAGPIPEDASDALAIALCHAHSRGLAARMAARA
ncbi:MAG TPA: crossover junction endodeoxyribonuclease RuvC [Gammaproteobacteria bacterium]|nr:crossover junction endodeoxyribonuclease RuvC [Gammaproteobacteria bacterium]